MCPQYHSRRHTVLTLHGLFGDPPRWLPGYQRTQADVCETCTGWKEHFVSISSDGKQQQQPQQQQQIIAAHCSECPSVLQWHRVSGHQGKGMKSHSRVLKRMRDAAKHRTLQRALGFRSVDTRLADGHRHVAVRSAERAHWGQARGEIMQGDVNKQIIRRGEINHVMTLYYLQRGSPLQELHRTSGAQNHSPGSESAA